jgi:hypothetical protein
MTSVTVTRARIAVRRAFDPGRDLCHPGTDVCDPRRALFDRIAGWSLTSAH